MTQIKTGAPFPHQNKNMGKPFWKVARQILIEENRHKLADISRALGMEYATLYSRLNGRTPFRLDEALNLLGRLQDQRLAGALLQHTDFIVLPRLGELAWGGSEDLIDLGIQSALRLLESLERINRAKTGHRIDSSDRYLIEDQIRAAERAIAKLLLALPHLETAAAPPNSATPIRH